MSALSLTAALVAARHDTERAVKILADTVTASEDREALMAETIGMMIGLLHATGHASDTATKLLENFGAVADAVAEGRKPDVVVVKSDQITEPLVASLFSDITDGTNRADRVWNAKELPGGMHAVALEGSGFTARYIAVMGGSAEQVEQLRRELAIKDGRW